MDKHTFDRIPPMAAATLRANIGKTLELCDAIVAYNVVKQCYLLNHDPRVCVCTCCKDALEALDYVIEEERVEDVAATRRQILDAAWELCKALEPLYVNSRRKS